MGLYPTARNQSTAETSQLRAEPWWSLVLGAPLLLRTLLRLVFVCRHQHKSPPMRAREPYPSKLPQCGILEDRGTYITCLDCGQKFEYNHQARRLVDFWGVRDAERVARVRQRVNGLFSPFRGLAARLGKFEYNHKARRLVGFWGVRDALGVARVRGRVNGFFSPFRGLAARLGSLNRRASNQLDRTARRIGNSMKGQWSKSRSLIASKWGPQSNLKQTQTRQEHN